MIVRNSVIAAHSRFVFIPALTERISKQSSVTAKNTSSVSFSEYLSASTRSEITLANPIGK